MNIRFLLSGLLLVAVPALAQNHSPVAVPIQNLTMRPSTQPTSIYLANNFSDPDLTSIDGTQVRITTTFGVVNLELFDSQTPQTVANFLRYISAGLYTNMFWHRSVPGFVLQTGGFTFTAPAGSSTPLATTITTFATVPNEPGISNVRGTVAMAKLSTDPNSATSQWFVNLADNVPNANGANLNTDNGGYTVFGRVIEGGMTAVDPVGALTVYNFSYYNSAGQQNTSLSQVPLRNYSAGTGVTANTLIFLNTFTAGPKMSFTAQTDNSGIVNPVLTGKKLTLTPNQTGTATVTVTAADFSGATATSRSTVTVSATAPIGKLANIATRAQVGVGEDVLIGGFVVTGTGTKRLLLRTLGPELTARGVPNVLPDPKMQLYQGSTIIQENDNWKTDPVQYPLIAATPFAPTNDLEPAIYFSASPGAYTIVVSGVNVPTGNALVEIYELDSNDTSSLINLSTRGNVGTADNVMIGGFVIGGTTPKRVLVRAVGPSLSQLGVTVPLANPYLQLYSGGTVIAQNDDWALSTTGGINPDAAAITASGFQPVSPQESAVIMTLAPGPYTAIVSGVGGTTGVALIEVYDLD